MSVKAVSRSAQIKRARRRVGGADPVNRLKWLIDFAQQSQTEAEVGASAQNLSDEIFEFSILGLPDRRGALAGFGDPGLILSVRRAALRAIEQWVGEGQLDLVTSELGQFVRVVHRRPGPALSYYHGAAMGAFLTTCANLIQAEGHRIERCARRECGRLFVRVKRGAYCSRQCSQRVRTEKFRSSRSKQELSEIRHRAYTAKVAREKTPAHASKVGRRKLKPRSEGKKDGTVQAR